MTCTIDDRPTRRLRRRGGAALVAGLLVLGACGGGDDAEATGDDTVESTADGAAGATDEGDDGSVGAEAPDDGADEVADGPSQGGEVRSLPGLAEYADVPLADFLRDAFAFPEVVPVLDLELARAYTTASAQGTDWGTLGYGADYVAPAGGPEEVFAVAEEMIDAGTWAPDGGITETSPGYHTRVWTSTDEAAMDLTIVFQEDVGEVVLIAGSAAGVTGAMPPAALWPWAGEVPTTPKATPVAWTVQIPDSTGGPAVYLDMRWRGLTGSYDALAGFVAALPSGALTAGEVTTETDPFTRTNAEVTAEGGFTGQMSAVQTDPASDPDLILSGRVDLEG